MSGRSREQVREELRASGRSKQAFIKAEMVRLGFWDADHPDRVAYEALGRRAAELRRELGTVERELSELHDVDKLKERAHSDRLEAARARRAETRARREQARRDRAAAWAARKARELLWLGPEVSQGLWDDHRRADPGKLDAVGLPVISDAPTLAAALSESLGGLRWLAFHRPVSQSHHYVRFSIPKKTGGERHISAPRPRLKAVQRTIAGWLSTVPLHDAAHGFVPGRSIVTNAQAHVGRAVVVNFDLRDFFPSIRWQRVRGVFESLGYGRPVATTLALLCTEADVEEVEVDGERWFVHTSERHLPQGSPASPVLTNLLCRRLDARLQGLARSLGFDYTRYADDLTFSARPGSGVPQTQALLQLVPEIVQAEGLVIHPDKTRIMRTGRRQEVTGLVVNERVGVPREQLRRYRAVMHRLRTAGPDGLQWGTAPSVFTGLQGFASFVHMVDPERGRRMLTDVRALGAAHGWTPPRRPVAAPEPPTPEAPAGDASGPEPAGEGVWTYITGGETKKWWQFWR